MNTWIFQSNPKKFQVDYYLKTYNPIMWGIRQSHFLNEISIGDEVYIWRSDGNVSRSGGIVAKGKITSLPQLIEDHTPTLWLEKADNELIPEVWIELESVRLSKEEGMIRKTDLINDKNTEDLQILSMCRHTNYKLEPRHARYINELWKQNSKIR